MPSIKKQLWQFSAVTSALVAAPMALFGGLGVVLANNPFTSAVVPSVSALGLFGAGLAGLGFAGVSALLGRRTRQEFPDRPPPATMQAQKSPAHTPRPSLSGQAAKPAFENAGPRDDNRTAILPPEPQGQPPFPSPGKRPS